MRNIRIGNDIHINWIIRRNDAPEDFSGKELTVKLIDACGRPANVEYTISGNVINITFYGKEQKQLGKYILCLIENYGKVNMNTLDKIDAFRLVQHSCDATGQDECPNLLIATLELTSFLLFGEDISVVQTVGNSNTDVMSQRAVTDELATKQDCTDASLDTSSKEVVGAINEIYRSLYYISVNEETETFNINNYE